MKMILSLAAAFLLAGVSLGGCIVVQQKGQPAAYKGTKKKGCPPGHVWSDGRCHDKGKGHDPHKHHKGKKGY